MAERGGALPGFNELEAARVSTGLTTTRFCELLGIPRPTWHRWRAASSNTKGPWPTPAQDAIETAAKELASTWEAWGHRKLAELLRVGGYPASDSTTFRVLARNGLTLPADYTGEVRQLARVRKEAFITPPSRRNRLWQADFERHEALTNRR